MNFFKSRKFKQGSAATIFTVLVIVLVIVVNMVASALSSRFSLSLDLTEGGFFTLSEESVEFLKKVDRDVTVYILSSEEDFSAMGNYYQQAHEVIKRYSQQSSHITIKYVDIVKDPTFVSLYPDLTLSRTDILVECGANASVLTAYDLFNTEIDYNTYRTAITSSKAEQALSSAILNVTSDTKVIVSVLEGHNEVAISDFEALLTTNNYEIIHQNLMTEEINPEATIAILCAPGRDLSDDEAKKLDAFLSNNERLGKTLFYLASATQNANLPVLDAFLADWGIKVNSGVVYESNQSKLFQMNIFMTLADYMEDDFSAGVRAKNMPAAIANARPMEFLFEAKNGVTTKGLLEFSKDSGIRPADAADTWEPSGKDVSGPILALGMGQLVKYDQLTPLTSTVLASGSETAIDAYLLGSTNIANSEYLLNLLNTLAQRDDVIYIQNKTIGSTQLGITSGQVISISLFLTIIFPIAVLIFGIVIWARRRHR